MRWEAVETNYERNGSEGSRLCRARNGDAASEVSTREKHEVRAYSWMKLAPPNAHFAHFEKTDVYPSSAIRRVKDDETAESHV